MKSVGYRYSQNSPLQDTQTQPFSQFLPPLSAYEVDDEEEEGVWGYMVPADSRGGEPMVLRSRNACSATVMSNKKETKKVPKNEYQKQEQKYEAKKVSGMASSGYLIGRHVECGRHHTRASGVMTT
jgi:serine/threonine-protein kinase Chk2